MSGREGNYVRVYWSIETDPQFDEVRDDDRRLGLWLRLLMLAEKSYPHLAPIPRRVHGPTLAHLVAAGLVELHPGDHFDIRGLRAERERRASRGRAGGVKRASTAVRGSRSQFAPSERDSPAFAGSDAGGGTTGLHQRSLASTHTVRTSEEEEEEEEEVNEEVTDAHGSVRVLVDQPGSSTNEYDRHPRGSTPDPGSDGSAAAAAAGSAAGWTSPRRGTT